MKTHSGLKILTLPEHFLLASSRLWEGDGKQMRVLTPNKCTVQGVRYCLLWRSGKSNVPQSLFLLEYNFLTDVLMSISNKCTLATKRHFDFSRQGLVFVSAGAAKRLPVIHTEAAESPVTTSNGTGNMMRRALRLWTVPTEGAHWHQVARWQPSAD